MFSQIRAQGVLARFNHVEIDLLELICNSNPHILPKDSPSEFPTENIKQHRPKIQDRSSWFINHHSRYGCSQIFPYMSYFTSSLPTPPPSSEWLDLLGVANLPLPRHVVVVEGNRVDQGGSLIRVRPGDHQNGTTNRIHSEVIIYSKQPGVTISMGHSLLHPIS